MLNLKLNFSELVIVIMRQNENKNIFINNVKLRKRRNIGMRKINGTRRTNKLTF